MAEMFQCLTVQHELIMTHAPQSVLCADWMHNKLAKFGIRQLDKCVPSVTFKEGRLTLTCTVQCPCRVRGMEMSTAEVSEPRKRQRNKSRSWCSETDENNVWLKQGPDSSLQMRAVLRNCPKLKLDWWSLLLRRKSMFEDTKDSMTHQR